MVSGPRALSGGRTIRTRILLIAWVPSLALLLIGGSLAGYLGYQSNKTREISETIRAGASDAGKVFQRTIENEAQLSAAVIADPKLSKSALEAQRSETNATFTSFDDGSSDIRASADPLYKASLTRLETALGALPTVRKQVDDGSATMTGVLGVYGQIMFLTAEVAENTARSSPDGPSAVEQAVAGRLIDVSASMALGNALANAAFSDAGMSELEYQGLVKTAGLYRSDFATLVNNLTGSQRAAADALINSDAWKQQLRVEEAALGATVPVVRASAAGTTATLVGRKADLPISRRNWDAASTEVEVALVDLGHDHIAYSAEIAKSVADRQLRQSLLAGGVLLLIALAVLVLTTRVSNTLIGRLRRLRSETLDLAQNRLPAIVARLRDGDKVKTDEELPPLDLGSDEIGQVADAFNYSQRVAVAAAVREAETRAGLRAVFLNIAYRSQVIVHQQLSVLERAERFQEDPEQLKVLFELDHLATRSRRNAENLVILGGGQPGRRWRNPVTLLQIVRGAISEAQDYARVSTTVLPDLAIRGAAVADVIHLLAELVDNATAFSPPMSRVEVRGNLVGRGLVLEIEDQGLGIPTDQLAELNAMLSDPPDFHVMALREEPRLGMFVVAQLARSQGIRVTLTPSPAYGGTKAVILIPSELIDSSDARDDALAFPRQPASVGRLSAVAEKPALVHSQPASSGPDSGSIDSLHERMAMGGRDFTAEPAAAAPAGGSRPGESVDVRDARSTSIADQLDRALPSLSVARTADPNDTPRAGVTLPGGKPALPRRRRQAHLDDRLRTPAAGSPQAQALADESAADPELARNRMAAFQRGTRRGRAESSDGERSGGENPNGST